MLPFWSIKGPKLGVIRPLHGCPATDAEIEISSEMKFAQSLLRSKAAAPTAAAPAAAPAGCVVFCGIRHRKARASSRTHISRARTATPNLSSMLHHTLELTSQVPPVLFDLKSCVVPVNTLREV